MKRKPYQDPCDELALIIYKRIKSFHKTMCEDPYASAPFLSRDKVMPLKQWRDILGKMVFGFEYMVHEDQYLKKLYKKYKIREKKLRYGKEDEKKKEYKKYRKLLKEQVVLERRAWEGRKLFGEWFGNLWN
jgi:hypothetical protein